MRQTWLLVSNSDTCVLCNNPILIPAFYSLDKSLVTELSYLPLTTHKERSCYSRHKKTDSWGVGLISKRNIFTMPNIVTLTDAYYHLVEKGAINYENMTVEGKQLLEVCGLSTENLKTRINEQIKKHGFTEEIDFSRTIEKTSGRPKTIFHFTTNAANHVLLAAMTEKGKTAREEAIELKSGAPAWYNLLSPQAKLAIEDLGEQVEQLRDERDIAVKTKAQISRKREASAMSKAGVLAKRIKKLEEAGKVYEECPSGYRSTTGLVGKNRKKFGIPTSVIKHVIFTRLKDHSIAVRNPHEAADGASYIAYPVGKTTEAIKEFLSECVEVTPKKLQHSEWGKPFLCTKS